MLGLKVLFSSLMLVNVSNAARILGVIPTQSYSHQVVFQPIWKELSLRGHQVTTITTNPINDPAFQNLTEIHLNYLEDKDEHIKKLINSNPFDMLSAVQDAYEAMGHNLYTHEQVQNLIKNESVHFDLVIVELGITSTLAFSARFNAPSILVLSFEAPSSMRAIMGSPTHPIAYPDSFLPIGTDLTLSERFQLVLLDFVLEYFNTFYLLPLQELLVKTYFGTHYPPVSQIVNDVSLLLTNSEPIFHGVKPLIPAIVQFGGGSHSTMQQPLPQDLKNILDSAEKGFIYFSLGSNVKSKYLPNETRQVIMDTFAELSYTVLWKFEIDDLPNKPKNVITSKWLPQLTILKHPNIKLFITQGGLQSIDEATYSYVPMIGMPFMGDQAYNVQKMVNKGYGLSIDYKTIRREEFKATILEIINNPKYRNTLKKLADLALDQPMDGLEKAVWWIEYVIRHNGTQHLRSPMLDIPVYQYFFLDVIALVGIILTILIVVLIYMIKLIFRLLRMLKPNKKVKKN